MLVTGTVLVGAGVDVEVAGTVLEGAGVEVAAAARTQQHHAHRDDAVQQPTLPCCRPKRSCSCMLD